MNHIPEPLRDFERDPFFGKRDPDAKPANVSSPAIHAWWCVACGEVDYKGNDPDRRPAWPWHLRHDSSEWCDGNLIPVTISDRRP